MLVILGAPIVYRAPHLICFAVVATFVSSAHADSWQCSSRNPDGTRTEYPPVEALLMKEAIDKVRKANSVPEGATMGCKPPRATSAAGPTEGSRAAACPTPTGVFAQAPFPAALATVLNQCAAPLTAPEQAFLGGILLTKKMDECKLQAFPTHPVFAAAMGASISREFLAGSQFGQSLTCNDLQLLSRKADIYLDTRSPKAHPARFVAECSSYTRSESQCICLAEVVRVENPNVYYQSFYPKEHLPGPITKRNVNLGLVSSTCLARQ